MARRWQDDPVAGDDPQWFAFRRSDASAVIDAVRAVAAAREPGRHGHGVDVVIEAPKPGFFAGLFGDHQPDQARIGVTKPGGAVGYPFHVQLITDHGADAGHLVPRLPRWACSRSAGLAFVMLKCGTGTGYDFGALVGGAVAALSALRTDAGDAGWRARVDRAVRRT